MERSPAAWEELDSLRNLKNATDSAATITVVRARLDPILWLKGDEDRFIHPRERTRARDYVSPTDAQLFLAIRSLLRRMLCAATGSEPDDLVIGENRFGKPFIERGGNGNLRFNLSHARTAALFAFSRSDEIGVDIEEQREMEHFDEVLRYTLSDEDYAAFGEGAADTRVSRFFSTWVRKEAILKAAGASAGNSLHLVSVPMDVQPGIWTVQGVRDTPDTAGTAVLYDLEVGDIARACLCTFRRPEAIRLYDLSENTIL